MQLDCPAIVCTVLPHGEHGAVVRFLTESHGLVLGYVRGARGRRLRPVLLPGNQVQLALHSRLVSQLGHATVELLRSRAPLMGERLPASALTWLSGLVAITLPEHQPFPRVYMALTALLEALENADRARDWAPALVRFELLLLAELGFGLDLSSCAATGTTSDLAYVSPRSAQAVSRAAGAPYAARLLPLPAFLVSGAHQADWADVVDGLRISGYFLERDLLHGRRAEQLLDARQRMVGRISALVPPAMT